MEGSAIPAIPRGGRRACTMPAATVLLAWLALVGSQRALAEDAAAWLSRAAGAAKQLNYVGTIVYQHGGRVEMSRLVHVNDGEGEQEKLTTLDGPAREIIRTQGEVRAYYPDSRVVRIEPRTFRNAFPSLSEQQQRTLLEYYDFRRAELSRVAGIEAQAYVFEPRDGLRYAQKFWADATTGLLLKARISNDANDVIAQFAFTDIVFGPRIDRNLARPSWPTTPPNWRIRDAGAGDLDAKDTGWTVTRLPPGFTKTIEGFRNLRGKRNPVAHLVFSDGLVAVSVFVEAMGPAPHPSGLIQRGATHVYMREVDDHLVTVLGEVPAAAVRQIAQSTSRR